MIESYITNNQDKWWNEADDKELG